MSPHLPAAVDNNNNKKKFYYYCHSTNTNIRKQKHNSIIAKHSRRQRVQLHKHRVYQLRRRINGLVEELRKLLSYSQTMKSCMRDPVAPRTLKSCSCAFAWSA